MADNQLRPRYIKVTSRGYTNKLHVLSAGPERNPSAPAVVFISGLGTPCLGFATVMRQLAKAGITSYAYDRAGLGRSPDPFATEGSIKRSPEPAKMPSNDGTVLRVEDSRSAIDMAVDLRSLLETANIPPPYVLSLHSYAGIIGREFIEKYNEEVVGVVFIDTNCENAADRAFGVEDAETLLSCDGLNFWKDSGLSAQHKLEPEEFQELAEGRNPPQGFVKGSSGGEVEAKEYYASVRGLRRLDQYQRHVLGKRPISVVKGTIEPVMLKILDSADQRQAGPEELRRKVRSKLVGTNESETKLQRGQLQLTEEGYGRMIDVEDAGHYVHVSHPQLVSKEIVWVIEQAGERGFFS